jgi:predicted nucleotidyltransferase component of viral defense system
VESFHQQLARIAFHAGDELGLVLAGGYAVSAHHLTDRPSRDLDFATASSLDLPEVAARLIAAYEEAGYHVSEVDSTSRMARFEVSDGLQSCEVDLLKEAIGPPVQLEIGPVLALDDAVGLKMRALHDRAAHRDFIDVRAAATRAIGHDQTVQVGGAWAHVR